MDDDGCEIFQVDESVFIGKDHQSRAWSKKNENITIGLTGKQNQQSAKMIGAKSNKGNYYYMVQKGYFNRWDILKFLKFLKFKNRNNHWGIFWDNCKTHHAIVVRDYMAENNISQVFNVPYSPEYNGIELLWAYQKQKFRKQITEEKVK